MDNQHRNSSVLSGSEARHNTPIQGTFSDLDFRDCDNREHKDIEKERCRILSKNSSLITNIEKFTESSRSDELTNGAFEMASQFSEIHASSCLPRLPEKSRYPHRQSGRKSFYFQDLAPRHRPKDTTCKNRVDQSVDLTDKQNSETSQGSQMESNKSVVSLPKIDTYCISQTRPVTNHGFAYMVSAYDLINAKKSTTPRPQTIKKSTQNVANNSASGNGFLPNSGDVFLLFRAPSRVRGLKSQPFTVKTTPKRKRQCKRSQEFQKTKEVKTNIIRLPDINFDSKATRLF